MRGERGCKIRKQGFNDVDGAGQDVKRHVEDPHADLHSTSSAATTSHGRGFCQFFARIRFPPFFDDGTRNARPWKCHRRAQKTL